MNTTAIEQEALHLSVTDRARLAHKLLLSLETMSESELEQIWFDEAERRASEIDQGLTKLISAEEVSRKAHALLK
jgi:putative addiction module component (TIGR02574 family)